MPQSFGLLAELPGFVGPTAVLAHLSQSVSDVSPVPDAGDAVAAPSSFSARSKSAGLPAHGR